jgi:glycosyltransferase involved in cell wall biosynthesis
MISCTANESWEIICDRTTGASAPTPPLSTTSGRYASCTQPLWTAGQCRPKHSFRCAALHAVSTGYAGFLGALLNQTRGTPLILSEHGIYTKERKIDLFKSEWIRDNRNVFQRDPTELSYFRQMWIVFLNGWAASATTRPTPSLRPVRSQPPAPGGRWRYCTGTHLQYPERHQRSPAFHTAARRLRPATPPPVLCLIGRVVPIKDIKTFIRAMRRVVNELPEAEGWIAGPEDEDPAYARNARDLVRSLGLEQEHVRFLGFQKVDDLMPKIGLTILSSISEALPLVILEGYAAGVPTISTDVGSCRQLIEGLDARRQGNWCLRSGGQHCRSASPGRCRAGPAWQP